METKIVTIDLGTRSYDIYIGSGLLSRIVDFVPQELEGRRAFVVTDKNVEPYALNILDLLAEAGAESVELLTFDHGEKTKSFKNVEALSHWLLDHGVSRDSVLFAAGGGVIGDLAGFGASIAMRGIEYIQVPTTLLSQVDSSVGGKTGINMPQGKNLIGSFYQPSAVIADIDVFRTLPKRELLAGYAEVVKYGLINDRGFFKWLEDFGKDVCALDPEALIKAIETSTQAKAAIVQSDETEQGQRALLNLGHTFGHALEAAAGYDGRLLHGEAVAIGIVMAFDLSHRMGLCSEDDLERVENHFRDIGLPTRASYIDPVIKASPDELLEIMGRDKKVSKGKMKFILVDGIGEAFVSDDVPEKLVKAVLKDSLGAGAATKKSGGSSVRKKFSNKGVKGLWKSAFSSRA